MWASSWGQRSLMSETSCSGTRSPLRTERTLTVPSRDRLGGGTFHSADRSNFVRGQNAVGSHIWSVYDVAVVASGAVQFYGRADAHVMMQRKHMKNSKTVVGRVRVGSSRLAISMPPLTLIVSGRAA